MKHLLLISTLFCSSLYAQGTFRIFDSQMNDITGTVVTLADTGVSSMTIQLHVENTDVVSHDVTAGRTVISQLAGTLNYFSWGTIGYVPYIDTSSHTEIMNPAGQQEFIGDYFCDTITGQTQIDYCFWERGNASNTSCVTVIFDTYRITGINELASTNQISLQPNPACNELQVMFGQGTKESTRIEIFDAYGRLVFMQNAQPGITKQTVDVSSLSPGIYSCMVVTDAAAEMSSFVISR